MASIQDFKVRKGISIAENAVVSGNVSVTGTGTYTGAATFANTVSVTGAATLSNTLAVTGAFSTSNTLSVSGSGVSSFATGNVTFDTDTLVVDSFNDRISINAASSTVALFVQGDANVSGTFTAANISFTNITGTTLTIGAGNSQFDSGTLFIDAFNNRIGINNTTPDASLTITGTANVTSSVRVGGTFNATLASGFANTLDVTGATTLLSTLGVSGAATLSSTLGVTGAATFSNTMAVTGTSTFTGLITGTITTANQCSRTVTAGSYLTGGGALTADRTLNVDATTTNTGSKVVARDASGNFSAGTITASLSGVATQANQLLWNGGYRDASQSNIGSTIMARDANGDTWARYFNGTATSTLYADLAEKYLADNEYPVGTVIAVGGEKEVTAGTYARAHSVLGVVSENPAFRMNEGLEGGTYVALKGRVPVRVAGVVQKGDRLIASSKPGIATVNNNNDVRSFAIALETSVDINERMVEAIIL